MLGLYRSRSFSPHLFCLGGITSEGDTFARHFGTPPDTMEDPFTGSATGGMAAYLWRYVDGIPKQNAWASMAEIPATTKLSDMMSKDLKKQGFNFVGSTICYAFMQAVGMINDHTTDCFRYNEIQKLAQQ